MSFTRWENWEKNVTRCDKNFRNSYFALSNNIYSRRRETFFHFFLTYDLHWIKILHRKQSMCNLATKFKKKNNFMAKVYWRIIPRTRITHFLL